jgi:hypothetical protein
MMLLFRAQLAAVEAEIRAKEAEISTLRVAREAAEAKLAELSQRRLVLEEEHKNAQAEERSQ